MNHVFRVLWNKMIESWVVVSELMTTRKKSGKIKIISFTAGLSLGISAITQATDVHNLNFNPIDCDNGLCSYVVSGGGSGTLSGSLAAIDKGKNSQTSLSYQDLVDFGLVVSGSPEYERLNIGAKTGIVLVPDPNIPGSYISVPVYNSSGFSSGSWSIDPSTGNPVDYYVSAGDIHDMQYIDARLGQVDSTGGMLTLDFGDPTKSISAQENYFALVGKSGETGKTSAWFHADGTAGNSSEIVWNSKNSVFLGYYPASAQGGEAVQSTQSYQVPVYAGVFDVTDAKGNTTTHTVTDVTSLAAYNDWVIEQLKQGNLSASSYNTVLSYGYSYKTESLVYLSSSPVTAGDEITLAAGTMALVQADGADAKVRLTENADIEARVNSSNIVLYGSNGGAIINDGVLSGYNTGSSLSALSALVKLDSGSTFENNGLLNVGFMTNGENVDTSTSVDMFTARGVLVGSNSNVLNTGIINVGSANQARQNLVNQLTRGISLTATGSKGANSGKINVAVNPDGFSPQTVGVELIGKSSFSSAPEFTNRADGEIYIGRSAQYLSGIGGKDLNAIGGIGISGNGASRINNAGTITIGTGTQGATGIKLTAGATGTNTSTGKIDVNGNVLGLQNIAVQAGDGSRFTNAGTINLNGVNQVGLKATSENLSGSLGKASQITSTGDVNINGNMGSEGVRSYGLLADGAGSTITQQGGAINLNGDGAIGAYALNGGQINISAGSQLNFNSGVKGIGFFAYGEGSTITIADSQPLDVSVADATLLRIENGASLNTQANQKLIASGKNATALVVSGQNSHANLDSLNIEITGEHATAVRVEGGATGEMNGASQLVLNDKSTAVVVDNIRTDINGLAVGRGQSVFTNLADIRVSDAKDIVLFDVNNGAKLINSGNIELSHGTGIALSGTGSTVSPDTAGNFGTITVHDGIAGIQVDRGATLNTSATITADGSASALLVKAEAGRVVINHDAHFTGKSGGYGNIITNQSSAGNVFVDGATIEMSGSGAALLSENNLDPASHGQIVVSSNTAGKGIALTAANGTKGDGSLEVADNWDISVTGNGSGVYSNTSGSLIVSGDITVTGAGNALKSDAADSIYINSGAVLNSLNSASAVVTGTMKELVNTGQILANTVTDNAIALSDAAESLINAGTGKISGEVNTGGGDDTVLYADNSSHNGVLFTDVGNDTVTLQGNNVSVDHLDGGDGNNNFTLSNVTNAVADARFSSLLTNFQTINLANGTVLDLQSDPWVDEQTRRALTNGHTLNIDKTSMLTLSSDQTLAAVVNNSGNVAFKGSANTFILTQRVVNEGSFSLDANSVTGDILRFDGDYQGADGTIGFDVTLNGDSTSPGDRMIVSGNTSGITNVTVANAGGNGALTLEGIELITVNGASDGEFVKKGRIVAGAYDYDLVRGNASRAANWYLTSSTDSPSTQPTPEEPTQPGTPNVPQAPDAPWETVPVLPEIPALPQPTPSALTAQVRPEAAAYTDNLYAANTLFTLSAQERPGNTRYVDTWGDEHATSLWLRQVGGQLLTHDSSGQNKTRSHRYVAQLGGDIAQWQREEGDIAALGVMVGYANQHGTSRNNINGYSADSSVKGYSTGLYGTWVQNPESGNGAYVDAWAQYSWFKNHVKGDYLDAESYRSKGVTVSLESGYAWYVGGDMQESYFIQPNAQVIWMGVHADNHVEANGTTVKLAGDGNVQTRAGVRLFRQGDEKRDDGNNRSFRPFVEANWIHNTKDFGVSLNDISVDMAGTRNLGEVKAGVQSQLTDNVSLWGSVAQKVGNEGFSDTSVLFGAKLTF